MDANRFDDFARGVAQARSRRGILRAVAGFFAGSAIGAAVSAPLVEAQVTHCGLPGEQCCSLGINSTSLGSCSGGAVCTPDQSLHPTPIGNPTYTCVCPTRLLNCHGKCQECCIATDCVIHAHATVTCASGTCDYTCDAGYRKCDGQCLVDTSPCKDHCPSGRTLVNGACAKKCAHAAECACGNCSELIRGEYVCSGSVTDGTCSVSADCTKGYGCVTGGHCLELC
jgi:hypothetical protein